MAPTSVIKIRTLMREEAVLFRDVRLKALLDSPRSFGRQYENEKDKPLSYWQSILNGATSPNKDRIFIAEKDGKPIGLLFGIVRKEDTSRCILGGMWVEPTFRKKGIASKLVKKALNWADELHMGEVALWNTEENEVSKRLYLKFDFAVTGRTEALRPDSEITIFEMKKILKKGHAPCKI